MKTIEFLYQDNKTFEVYTVELPAEMSLLNAADNTTNVYSELLEIETLEMYLDHKILNDYRIEILNDYEIMSSSVEELVNNGKLYNILRSKYEL